MKKWFGSRMFWGIALIVAGILVLIDSLWDLEFIKLFWVIIGGLGTVYFLSLYVSQRDQWWWLVPGLSLFGIAIASLVAWINPSFGEQWSATIVLGMIALSFLSIYIFENEHWWTLVPAGTLITIGLLTGMDGMYDPSWGKGLFVLGLAVTFTLIAILPTKAGRMNWAWIPTGILWVSGIFLILTGGKFLAFLVPLLLIISGIILVIRYSRQEKATV